VSHKDFSRWEPVEFKPKEASREDWAKFHEYRRVRHMDTDPEDPITPDDIVEMNYLKDDPFGDQREFVLFDKDKKIASLGIYALKPGAPGYEENKEHLWGGGSVRKEHRRQGIGTTWLFKLKDMMLEYDRTIFTTGTQEEDGFAFMQWLGLEPKQVMDENRLDFRKVDWDMIQQWIKEGREKSPDTKVEIYENRMPEEMWEEYAPELSRLLNTMPFDDLEHGEIVITPEVFKEHYERLDQMKAELHTIITREPDGTISSMTDVRWLPHRENFVDQMFTGVDPAARGRGLGKLIKAQMLDLVRNKYTDIHWVVTENANTNEAMLAINRKLGFALHKPHRSYQIRLDELEKFLAGL
jgi:GNAT superfamily N-acetyltransferase